MSHLSRYVFCLTLAGCLLLCSCSGNNPEQKLLTIQGSTMGTTFAVKVLKTNPAVSCDSLEHQINRRLEAVNNSMSTYRDSSEISRFNQLQDTGWFAISADFATVLRQAREISRLSHGALDITVGPLVNLWGFGRQGSRSTVPRAEDIESRRAYVGYQKAEVADNKNAVRKQHPSVQIDLSAIAKGFGVDCIAMLLDSLQLHDYLVEVGGEVRASGHNAAGMFWRVGVASPESPAGIDRIVPLQGVGMATSGDYMNYFEQDGVRYSHTIDPRTGSPITHALASVTVIHPLCSMADGLATAIDVLGPEAGLALAEELKLPVYLIIRQHDGFTSKMTTEFAAVLATNSGKGQ